MRGVGWLIGIVAPKRHKYVVDFDTLKYELAPQDAFNIEARICVEPPGDGVRGQNPQGDAQSASGADLFNRRRDELSSEASSLAFRIYRESPNFPDVSI